MQKFQGRVDAARVLGRQGLWSYGVPVLGGDLLTKGNVFHVDSGSANASDTYNTGKDPNRPLATIDAAIGLCTANNGDIILVNAGHAETLLTAAAINCDVAGIAIIGIGQGEARPIITVGATATGGSTVATVAINAANVVLRNLVFKVGIDALAILLDVNSTDALIQSCEFRATAAKQPGTFVDVTGTGANATDRVKIYACHFESLTAGADRAIELGQVADSVEIAGNWIEGDWNDAAIHNPVGKVLTNLLIKDNVVSNYQAGDHAIEIVSACTGSAVGNLMYSDAYATCFDPGSLMCNENYGTKAIDESGVEIPLTPSGAIGVGGIGATSFQAGAIDAAAIAADAVTKIGADQLSSKTLPAAPVAGSLARFVASGGTALGTPLADSKSLVDALGSNGTTLAYGSGSALGAPGTVFAVTKAITQSAIVAAGVDLTGVSSGGALELIGIYVQNGATAADSAGHGAVLEIKSNNVAGSIAFLTAAQAKLAANAIVTPENATSHTGGVVLETGKKITALATTEDFTSAGSMNFILIFRRLAAGATIAAA